MKAMLVGDLKANFSEVLEEAWHGEKVGILYDTVKKPVAMLVPYSGGKKPNGK